MPSSLQGGHQSSPFEGANFESLQSLSTVHFANPYHVLPLLNSPSQVEVEWILEVATTSTGAEEPYDYTRLAWLGDAAARHSVRSPGSLRCHDICVRMSTLVAESFRCFRFLKFNSFIHFFSRLFIFFCLSFCPDRLFHRRGFGVQRGWKLRKLRKLRSML